MQFNLHNFCKVLNVNKDGLDSYLKFPTPWNNFPSNKFEIILTVRNFSSLILLNKNRLCHSNMTKTKTSSILSRDTRFRGLSNTND